MNQPGGSEARDQVEVSRHEESLRLTKESRQEGVVRARKTVTSEPASEYFPRNIEDVEMERINADEVDSGEIETLPDGSISIPVLEEELIVSKRVVVRERIIIRKHTRTEYQQVQADLRRERVDIDYESNDTR